MSSIHETSEGTLAFVKGAPKEMLVLCSKININGEVKKLTKDMLDEILKYNDDYARRALRVLALAYTDLSNIKEDFTIQNVRESSFSLVLLP